MTNKEWLERYPWLGYEDDYAEPEEESLCAMDYMLVGWREAFGELFCEDIDKIIKEKKLEDFKIIELKEKCGQLRVYCNHMTPEIVDVLRTYESCSENVCCRCGSIENVKFTNFGWCEPICKSCVEKTGNAYNIKRFNALPIEELPTVLRWSRYSKNGTEHFEMDISETVKKIRERYEQRKRNGEFERLFDEWEDDYYGA